MRFRYISLTDCIMKEVTKVDFDLCYCIFFLLQRIFLFFLMMFVWLLDFLVLIFFSCRPLLTVGNSGVERGMLFFLIKTKRKVRTIQVKKAFIVMILWC